MARKKSARIGSEEGKTTRVVEKQTKKIPSIGFLSFAVGSMVASATLQALRKRELSNFVGLWAPSILIMGLYNKLVKVEEEVAGLA
jgi:hypothetical protein